MHYQKSLEILGKGDVKRGKRLLFSIAEDLEYIKSVNGKTNKDDFVAACKMAYDKMILETSKECE